MATVQVSGLGAISKIDAVAQCTNCKRIWSYDGLDAILEISIGRKVGPPVCPGCGHEARLFQERI